jgi:hypothetical protein
MLEVEHRYLMLEDGVGDEVEDEVGNGVENRYLTVGGLETETFKLCTEDPNFKNTALLIVSSHRVVSWAAYASWKACYA